MANIAKDGGTGLRDAQSLMSGISDPYDIFANKTNPIKINQKMIDASKALEGTPQAARVAEEQPKAASLTDKVKQAAQDPTEGMRDQFAVPVSEQQWNIISRAAAQSENPDEELSKYAAALTFSREYGIPLDAAYSSLDDLTKDLLGKPYTPNATGFQAISNSFKAGRLNMQFSDLAYRFKQADLAGEDTSAMLSQLDAMGDEIANLKDYQKRNVLTTVLKWTAEGAVPYMMEVGKSALEGATFAGALGTGFTAATGISLGSIAAASPYSLAAIIGMGATVGAVNRTRELMEGASYLQLRQMGIDKDIANVGSRTYGLLVGAIEAGLGIEAGTVIKAAGGSNLVNTASSKVMAKLITNNKLAPLVQGLASLGANATGEAVEEMIEEPLDYLTRNISYAVQDSREPGSMEPLPDESLVRNTLEAGLRGFASAIVLGGPSAVMDGKTTIDQQASIRKEAAIVPSKEAFVSSMKEQKPETITPSDWTSAMSEIWEKEHSQKPQSTAIQTDENAVAELDIEKAKAQPTGEVRRLKDGSLYTQEAAERMVSPDGTEQRRILIGDPATSSRYGYIDYGIKGNTITIEDVLVKSGYENIRKEAILSLAKQYQGYEIQWEPKSDALSSVRDEIMSSNPRGQEAGLQYWDGITNPDERLMVERQIEKAMPNLTAPERALGATLMQLRAEAAGMSTQAYLDASYKDGKLFGDTESLAVNMQGKRGAVAFDDDLKAIIYAGQNADFSTFAHETFHVSLRQMGQLEQFKSAVTEASRKPEFITWLDEHAELFKDSVFDGKNAQDLADIAAGFTIEDWGRTQEEFAARLYEGYLADGKTASIKLKQLFSQIAKWMAQIYTTLRHSVDLDPRIIEVFDSLSDKQSPLAKQLVTQEENKSQMKSGVLHQEDAQAQYDAVVSKYRNTDQWMKAPNGKQTNLTERQWVQVRTPAFIEWFGDWMNDPENASKVVDENGEPKVVHHYTSEKFSEFEISKARQSMDIPGFYFSDEKTNWKDMGENLVSAFLNIRNPIDGKPPTKSYGMKVRENLIAEGYDGAITIDEDMDETEYLAFYPSQIKSATDNVGTFDGENPNILFQEAPPDYQPKKTGIGYKVFIQKDGKLYPPMVANPNGEGTPVGKWLIADEAPIAGYTKTGRPQVKSGGKGTQGKSGLLAYRPGWHLGEIPYAKQFNRLNPETGVKELFPKDFVWAEVEYSKDNDYNEEARNNGKAKNGGFNHALASLNRMPTDGFYNYRTNPDPTTDPWVITGAMKVNKILTREEVDSIVKNSGRNPQKVEGDNILFQEDSKPKLDTDYPKRPKADILNMKQSVQAQNEWRQALDEWVSKQGDLLQFGDEKLIHVVHKNVKPDEKPWRSTTFIARDSEWVPFSHVDYDTKYEAVLDSVGGMDYRPDILFQESKETRPLDKRVRGDRLLDTLDLIDEVKQVGATVSDLGIVTLYHATSKAAAKNIVSTGMMIAKEDGLFFSTKSDGQISGYGESVVKLEIPAELLEIDDIFEDEAHLYLSIGNRRSRNVIGFGPSILFQDEMSSEEFILEEARGFGSWQDWKAFYRAYEDEANPAPTDDAWYEQMYNKANGITSEEDAMQAEDARQKLETEQAKDQYMIDQLSTDEGVKAFMSKLEWMLSGRALREVEGDQQAAETILRVQQTAPSLVNPFILSNAQRLMGGRQLSQKAIKSIRTMMTGDALRYYRDIYADVMEDPQLKPQVIDDRLPKIDDPGYKELERLSISERLKLANHIQADELRKPLLSGKETFKGATEIYIKDRELQIKELNEKVLQAEQQIAELEKALTSEQKTRVWVAVQYMEDRKKLDAELKAIQKLNSDGKPVPKSQMESVLGMQAKLDKLHDEVMQMRKDMRMDATIKKHEAVAKLKAEIAEKQKQKAEAKKIREYKLNLARKIMVKPSDAINYEHAQAIYGIQALIDPNYRREGINIAMFGGKATLTVEEAKAYIADAFAEGTTEDEIINAIGKRNYDRLIEDRKPLNDWTIEELEELANEVAELRHQGRRILEAKKERQLVIAQQYQDSIIRSLIATGRYTERPIVGTREDQKEKTSPKRTALAFRYATLPMRAKAMKLDGDTQGSAYNLLITQKRAAQAREWIATEKRMKPVMQAMKDAGLTEQDLYQTVSVALEPGKSVDLTYSALMYVYLSQFDDSNKAAVAYGNLVPQDDKAALNHDNKLIQTLGQSRYEAVLDQATFLLGENDGKYMKMLEAVRKDFNGQKERLNEVAIREYNQPMRNVEEYLPIHRKEFSGDDMASQIADDFFNQNAGGVPTGVQKGFTKDRIAISADHQRPIDLDLMQVWNRSVRQQEHFIAFAEYGRKLNRVFKNPGSEDMKNVIGRTLGMEMLDDINDYITEVVNPVRETKLKRMEGAVRFMRGNLGAAYLTWKMSSLVLQAITSPFPFLIDVKPVYFAKGYLELMSDRNTLNRIYELSPMMKNRTMNVIIDQILQQSRTYTDSKAKRLLYKSQEMGSLGLTMVDRYAVAGGWLGAYHQRLDQLTAEGIDTAKAERMAATYADDITLKVQPTGDKTEIAPLFTTGSEFAKAFTQFQTAMNVIWTNLTYDLPVAMKKAQFSNAVGTIVAYGMAGALLGAVADGYDEDDDLLDKLRKWIYWSFTQGTGSVPLIGDQVDEVVKSLVTGDKPVFFADDFFPGMSKVLKGVGNLTQGEFIKALENLGKGAGYMAGVPVSGIQQAVDAVKEGPQVLLGR